MTTDTKPTLTEQFHELAKQREEAHAEIEAGREGAGLWAYYDANEAWLKLLEEGFSDVGTRITAAIGDVSIWAKLQGEADVTTDVEMKRYYERIANEALIRFDEGMAACKPVFEALGSVNG